MNEKEFIELIAPMAVDDMKKTGILASVTIAQAILESGYGGTDLARKANNLFGMKCTLSGNTWDSVWDGESKYRKKTQEQDVSGNAYYVYADFRKYDSFADSIADHSAYLCGAMVGRAQRYAGLIGCTDYEEAIKIIKGGGYATDVNYVSKICSIIEKWDLMRFDVDGGKPMNVFVCVGHAHYGDGVISSADGRKYGGVNEYEYNKKLAPYVVKWLQAAGHKATLCIAPEGKMKCLDDEINYFIGEEHKKNYDLSIQLHLNAFYGKANGCEVYAYNAEGQKVADKICKKLGTVWKNRGSQIRTDLYWTRQTKAKAVLIESFFCDSVDDYKKAKELGYDGHGKLIAEGIIGKDIAGNTSENSQKADTAKKMYRVQIGAYTEEKNAKKQLEKAQKAGFADAFIKYE